MCFFYNTPEGCKKKDCPFAHKKLNEKEQAELRPPPGHVVNQKDVARPQVQGAANLIKGGISPVG